MKRFRCPLPSYAVVLAFGLGAAGAFAEDGAAVSEQDFFGEMPVVLSVSRLAQPLNETPGAVTVIDRDMIRRSGAREVADLMRLVPGFLTTQRNGANPIAVYHGDFDALNRRLQVFIDGRSVYSTYYVGGVHHGLMGVVLEDIERIEVLRGSNSAAYGANAFLGVVNIVTRNAADSQGTMLAYTKGNNGIEDNVARIGWGSDTAHFRLTAARRTDFGLKDQYDDKKVSQAHFRGDLKPSTRDDVMVQLGTVGESAGDGFVGSLTDSARTTFWRNAYAHGSWRRQIDPHQELQLSAHYDDEVYRDAFLARSVAPAYTAPIETGGRGNRFGMTGQHNFSPVERVRVAWGGEYRREEVRSFALFNTTNSLSTHLWRVFGNVEWRPHDKWTFNWGGLGEHQAGMGYNFSPRLMANFHVLPDHTLRAGTTEAHRQPTLFERRGDMRWYTSLGVVSPQVQARGDAKQENLQSTEIGYLGNFRSLGVTVDFRGFEEKIQSLLRYDKHGGTIRDVVNKGPERKFRGWETQLRWQPVPETQILLNHTVNRVLIQHFVGTDPTSVADRLASPSHFSTLAWFQRFSHGYDFSAIYTATGPMAWSTFVERLDASHQLDLRLARGFKIGTTKGEAAISVQSLEGGHQEYQNFKYSGRRAYVTLRLDL